MTTTAMTTREIRSELDEIAMLLPPPGMLPEPGLLARLQTHSLRDLYRIIVLAMIDGRYELHRTIRISSRVLWTGGRPSVGNSSIHRCIDAVDAAIRRETGSVRETKELADVFYCGGEGSEKVWRLAHSISDEILSPMKERDLFDLVREAALYEVFDGDCDFWLCEGALAVFFTKVGASNHEKMMELTREDRLLKAVLLAAP